MNKIKVIGWKEGFSSVRFVTIVKEYSVNKIGLKEGLDLVTQVLNGKEITIEVGEGEEGICRFSLLDCGSILE